MSLRAIVEVVLHLESFRNIDLFQQGLYYLEFEVFHTMKSKKFSASPYNIFSSESSENPLKVPPEINDIYYKSQTFYIKYCDEDVEINEIAVFRTEVEVNNQAEIPNLKIQCNLMYYDMGGRISERMIKNLLESPQVFTKEASLSIDIPQYIEGVNQFVPIIFDDMHFCLLNSTVHVFLIDFRFRPTPMMSSSEEQAASLAKLPQEKEVVVEPLTLADIFFANAELNEELIDVVYEKYIKLLLIIHERTTELIKGWSAIVGSEDGLNPVEIIVRERFSSRITETQPSKIAELILNDIQALAGNMHHLLFTFIQILQKGSKQVTIALMHDYNQRLKDKWGESIFRKVTVADSFTQFGESNLSSVHKSAARSLRNSEYYRNTEKIAVSVMNYFPSPEFHPILFLDVTSKLQDNEIEWSPTWVKFSYNRTKPTHLVVFVHGFQGNSFDVRLIRNQVALCRPDTLLMCSHMNEGETEGDILSMGKRLSEEVIQYINEWCPKNTLQKVSFIGHSLGGLIIRASLPHLSAISPKFHFLITFSSPHLGYMYNSSKIVDAGLWIIKKWKKSECLKQLSMTDSTDAKSSLLYALSQAQGFEWFKHIALVGAHQDNYAPFESARIEVGAKAATDNKGRLYIDMANNLMTRVTADRVHRIDINLKLKGKSIDSMIGRAAHIQMLDNHILVQMVLHCCAHFFQ